MHVRRSQLPTPNRSTMPTSSAQPTISCSTTSCNSSSKSALDTLPQRTADIFRMSRYESLKNREIAQQLGISITAVEKHISKALKTIAAQLAQKYGTSLALCLMLCLEHAQQAV